ncbi:MAG: hypothetical protein IPK35_07055 [Saprospiraceae bacterium]|nr:hypothetical protein [Saprospiraceae bacterium]
MKSLVSSFFILLVFLSPLFGQNGENNTIQFYEIMKSRDAGKPLELNGSEFLYDEWIPMKIFMEDGRVFDVAQARINILGGSIDVMHKGREMELLLTFIDKVEINHESRSKSMMPIFRVKAKELPEKGFVEVLNAGEDIVLVRYHKYIVKADPNAKILGLDPRPKVFNKQEIYVVKSKIAYEVSSKRILKKVYKNKSRKIDEIFDAENIDIKNPLALASLIARVNVKDAQN